MRCEQFLCSTMFPLGLESVSVSNNVIQQGSHSDWRTWKNGKAFSSQGILNRLEKSGKIRENT